MWFEVLGPVRAWRDTAEVDLGSPQQRAVLAMLLLGEGRPVSVDRLVDGLWRDAPPRHAAQVARTYVSRLRKILNMADPLLFTEVNGYALRPADGSFDLPIFETALRAADEAQTGGDLARADRVLGEALALWHGEPLAGITAPWAETPRTRLVEKRLTIREARCRIGLELGRHTQEVAELMELCREHPYRERLRELLMLALHRCGRTAEALGVYANARKLFADELGIAPGHELSTLHDRILRDDSALLMSVGVERGVTRIPAQLPARARDFTGRSEAVAALLAAVADSGAAVVSGMGGVGKTALTVHVAQRVTTEFDGGQLYANLRGAAADPADPANVLAAFLTALGVAEVAIPRGLVERATLYRSMLAGQRVMVVLDDAHDAAQVHPLLPGSPDCAVLVTSRARRIVIDGAHHLHLDVMRPDEAVALLRAVVGARRVDAESAAARELTNACGLLPLSIRLVGARLAARPGWSVSDVVANLVSSHRIPGAEVESAFELSYRQLTADQARAFRLLAVADSADFSLEAAGAMLRIGNVEAEDLLESLVDASLLDSRVFGRYYYHDVTRAFAHLRLRGDEARCTLRRLLDFYLATACTAFHLAVPGDPVTEIAIPPECPGLRIPDPASARAWVTLDADNILAAVCQSAAAADRDWDAVRTAVDLLVVLCPYNQVIRYVRLEPAVTTLWRAVGAQPDPRVVGRIHFLLSMVQLGLGRAVNAEASAQQSVRSCEATGDAVICCQALNVLGRINRRRRRYEEALRYYRRSLELARTAGHRSVEAITMANLAAVLVDRGDPADAVPICEQALATAAVVEDANARAYALHTLGIALHRSGRHQDAADMQQRCLEVSALAGLTQWQAHALFHLANALVSLGRPAEAARYAEQALVLCRELSDPVAEAYALTSMAAALAGTNDIHSARTCLRNAHRMFHDLGMPAAQDALRRLRELGDSVDGGNGGAPAELTVED